MISPKMSTSDLLKINVFWNKSYEAIIYVNDATSKDLSRDSNYVVDMICSCDQSFVNVAFLWEKLSQPPFFETGIGSSSIVLDWR